MSCSRPFEIQKFLKNCYKILDLKGYWLFSGLCNYVVVTMLRNYKIILFNINLPIMLDSLIWLARILDLNTKIFPILMIVYDCVATHHNFSKNIPVLVTPHFIWFSSTPSTKDSSESLDEKFLEFYLNPLAESAVSINRGEYV